jgi:imidazoleglycerol phosphate dehydratase HisB
VVGTGSTASHFDEAFMKAMARAFLKAATHSGEELE